MAVYTACFLEVPAVVSYGRTALHNDLSQDFMRQWTARHAAISLVPSTADRELLLALGGVTAAQIQVVHPELSALIPAMQTLYQRLSHST
jgi:hypothetical protein